MNLDQFVTLLRGGQEGIREWNLFRDGGGRPNEHPWGLDLQCLDLSGANLAGLNLAGCLFGGADLTGANLENAVLATANFSGTKLKDASLRCAVLRGATFRDNFRLRTPNQTPPGWLYWLSTHTMTDPENGTRASWTMSFADYGKADFAGSHWGSSDVGALTLLDSVGLDSAFHSSPSRLSLGLLRDGRRTLPDAFLLGCGLSNEEIGLLSGRVQKSARFYSCFISYSGLDQVFARLLYDRMKSEGLRVWFAGKDMRGGRTLFDQVNTAIHAHDRFLLVLSENSMASHWVATEIKRTLKAEKESGERKLFPIRLCETDSVQNWELFDADIGRDIAADIRAYYLPDFSKWQDPAAFEVSFGALLRDLESD